MTGFEFRDPWWLALAVLLVWLGLRAARRPPRAGVLYSETSLLRLLPKTPAQGWKRLLPWMRVAGMALLVVALARPRCGEEEFRVRAEGIAIMMCVDRSGSMETPLAGSAGRQSRLEAVRQAFRDFVAGTGRLPGRPNDLIGLIAFTGYVENKCPLTLDHEALLQILDTVHVTAAPWAPSPAHTTDAQPAEGDPGEPGGTGAMGSTDDPRWAEERLTALGDAVAAAIDRLNDVRAKSKVIVVLSDGEQTAGAVGPAEAAEAAKALGIKIHAIGLSRQQTTLRLLAETTGGRCFEATDAAALGDVYAEIDRLERSVTEGRLYTQYRELYLYGMLPGLGLVLLEIVLASTRLRTLP